MTFQRFVEIIATIYKSKCTNEEEQTGVAKSEEWKQFFWACEGWREYSRIRSGILNRRVYSTVKENILERLVHKY